MLLSVLAAILLLGILITVHEFGHFIAARLTGIDVMEFAIGFGPKLVGWTGKKGTKFSLRAIPLGGFCAFYGEDDAQGNHKDDPRAYNNQSVWKRMLTIIMGPMMNFVLAFVAAVGYFMYMGAPVGPEVWEPYLAAIEERSPASVAGLEAGDVIVTVDGVEMLDGTVETLLAHLNRETAMNLTVRRGESTFDTVCTPMWDADNQRYRIGVSIGGKYVGEYAPMPLGDAISNSAYACWNAGRVIFDALTGLFTRGEGLDQTSGPVGVITQVSQQVRQDGFEAFMNLLVVISINLGMMNLLPIPGLDGSRFLFTVVEAIRRKPIAREKEAMVHLIGMVFLFGLMIFFTIRDVAKLF
ncbi:MAG: PDZ domain-containing protein [Clostridiales bacterium]|nr:PDZ domain-containing protein [Clostridiales bacterium]